MLLKVLRLASHALHCMAGIVGYNIPFLSFVFSYIVNAHT